MAVGNEVCVCVRGVCAEFGFASHVVHQRPIIQPSGVALQMLWSAPEVAGCIREPRSRRQAVPCGRMSRNTTGKQQLKRCGTQTASCSIDSMVLLERWQQRATKPAQAIWPLRVSQQAISENQRETDWKSCSSATRMLMADCATRAP